MSYNKETAIAAQNAGTTAAVISGPFDPQSESWESYKARYVQARELVFQGTLEMAGAETVVQHFEPGTHQPVLDQSHQPQQQQNDHSAPQGGGGGGLGSFKVKGGKYDGMSFDDVAQTNPGWFNWAAGNLNNDYLKGKVLSYLQDNPYLRDAA